MTPTGSRILVTGLPGVGKTSVAQTLAERLGVKHIELDELYYGPNWATRETFLRDLEQATDEPRWVLDDFGAPESQDLVWSRADTLVWLDLPFGVAFGRAVRRTWRRLRSGYERTPGLHETWLGWATPKHPVRLSLTSYGSFRDAMEARLSDPRFQQLEVIRLRSVADVDALLGPAPYKLSV